MTRRVLLALDLRLEEGPGGIVRPHAASTFRARRRWRQEISGTGPLDDYSADLRPLAAAVERIGGSFTLTSSAEAEDEAPGPG